MHHQGSWRGAVNAYSRALQLDESATACLANRAACHLQLGDARCA